MNFIFISPNFPQTYWHFCDCLKKNGVNVLGIGDCPYDELRTELKVSLTEYYKVATLEDYDTMYRAVAYFACKYGRIDWLESNNEFWLEQDAKLRTDFNVTTGVREDGIEAFKSKAEMKKYYALAGVPTARQCKLPPVAVKEDVKAFIGLVSYPVIVKPEIGVGATATYKLSSDADLDNFLASRPGVPYVMEEFITGDIYSYDAIVDSHCNPLFESSARFPPSVMDIVNEGLDLNYYVLAEIPGQLRERGRATLKGFGVKSRFVHFEFFCLAGDRPGLGKKGDFVGLEVNMRPAGGYTPDMMNFAHSTDVYRIWADMVVFDKRILPESGDDHYCVYFGRRDKYDYVHTHEDVLREYGGVMRMCERMPEVLSSDMGNQMYTVDVRTMAAVEAFIEYASAKRQHF